MEASQRRTPEEKFVLYFEAAKRSLLAAQTLLRRLESELAELEPQLRPDGQINELIVPALLSAVSFVDFAHRFGELMNAMPLLPNKPPQLRALREALVPVEKIRNHLQHLRGELATNDPIEYPLLGSICWTSGEESFAVAMSQMTQTTFPSMVYDVVNGCWVSTLQYNVGNIIVNIHPLFAEMEKAYRWLTKKVQFSEMDFAKLEWGKTTGFSCKFQVTAIGPPTGVTNEHEAVGPLSK